MFNNDKDEEELCNTLKALVEEWGPERLTVHLPLVWDNKGYSLYPCKLAFDTKDTIEFEVNYGTGNYTAKVTQLCHI